MRLRQPEAMAVLRRLLLSALLVASLAITFVLYTRPEFLVHLSQQVWGCF